MTRLIDADALIQALEKKHAHWHELVTEENKEIEFAHSYALNVIRNAPTADAKPTVIQSKTLLPTKDFMEWAKRIKEVNPNAVVIPCDAEVASAEAVQGWIPCSERLPKKGEVVLITNGKGNVRCGQYRSEHDVRGETHYWWWKGKTVESVLAWMPLPKQYREESKVEE